MLYDTCHAAAVWHYESLVHTRRAIAVDLLRAILTYSHAHGRTTATWASDCQVMIPSSWQGQRLPFDIAFSCILGVTVDSADPQRLAQHRGSGLDLGTTPDRDAACGRPASPRPGRGAVPSSGVKYAMEYAAPSGGWAHFVTIPVGGSRAEP
jgi:hypothetical protein